MKERREIEIEDIEVNKKLYVRAIDAIKHSGEPTIKTLSFLQRKLMIGFNDAYIIETQLIRNGIIAESGQVLIDLWIADDNQ